MAYYFNETSHTFNEYLLVPGYSSADCIPANVSLKTPLVKYKKGEEPAISMNIPLTSAIMQSVSGDRLAVALAREGGVSFIYGSQSAEDEAAMVEKAKSYKAGFVVSESNVTPDDTLADILALKAKNGHSTVAVTSNGKPDGKLLGIVTSRDYRVSRMEKTEKVVNFMTPFDKLVCGHKDITLKEVKKIYEKLNIKFDSYAGESFYNDKMQPVIDELTEKGLLVESDGAKVVKLDDYGMPPCIILRSDGASLYATRDLAAALYRKKTYDFYKCLYVVAYQQDLHFKQLFKVLELMGKEWAKDMVHVSFGMVSLEDGAMSTREGKVVLLEDVLNKAVEKCLNIINEKNPNLEDKENVAEIVGIGAVIFGTLFSGRIKDITFSYDKMLNFDGETGPYVQYTCARCKSVLRKSGEIKDYKVTSVNDDEYALTTLLARFPEIVKQSAEKYEPSIITRYSVDLAEAYNKFYFDYRILGEEDDVKNYRLALTSATLYVLSSALRLLGISVPKKM
ncbi:MAG TPA: arginine--tRNA ligase [Clostridiales bacterium]|nr:arginine--tRNA ligase [Clostridiales bacterium]